MAKVLCRLCLLVLFLFIFGAVFPTHADTGDLITTLTNKLGVTKKTGDWWNRCYFQIR